MYCTSCGRKMQQNELFCPVCGTKHIEIHSFTNNNCVKKSLYAFYISILTLPLLFIIRMMTQVTEHISASQKGVWRDHDIIVVPENIRAIMITLLIVSTFLTISFIKNSKPISIGKANATTFMIIINCVLGVLMTFLEF